MIRKNSTRKRSSRPGWQHEIAAERIQILFKLAERELDKHPDRSKRYVELSRKIGMRHNVKIPAELRRKFCKQCNSYLHPGKNSVVRSNSKTKAMEVKCLACGHVSRYPYVREKGSSNKDK